MATYINLSVYLYFCQIWQCINFSPSISLSIFMNILINPAGHPCPAAAAAAATADKFEESEKNAFGFQ